LIDRICLARALQPHFASRLEGKVCVMVKQLRPLLACSALLCALGFGAPAATAAAQPMRPAPRVIMAPHFIPAVPGRTGAKSRAFRDAAFGRGVFARRRFRGQSGLIGVGGDGYPVPVQIGGGGEALPQAFPEQAYPADVGGYGPIARPPPNPGPQIIVLPDPPGARKLTRSAQARFAGVPAPRWSARANAPWIRLWRVAHRPVRHPWYAGSYAYEPSPVALMPCTDAPTSVIYNTPCGVRPYE